MLITQITGDQIRAGRALAGLSQEILAVRSRLCRQTIHAYELSSDAVPAATVSALGRVITVLESAGVRFSPDGVALHRSPQPLPSETAQIGAAP
jgi:transcriptional regulator with XRE-family HTH domain